MSEMKGIVVCHFDEHGNESYHVFGDESVRLFIVDDRAPHDRVYEVTTRDDPAEFRRLIPEGSDIGHQGDDRHPALKARIEAVMDGRAHLSSVKDDQ